MKLNLNIEINIVEEFKNKDIIAKIYYPDEGNKIEIIKGLNKANITSALFHEFGHLIDWYLSKEKQSEKVEIRENIAETIEESLIEIIGGQKMSEYWEEECNELSYQVGDLTQEVEDLKEENKNLKIKLLKERIENLEEE